MNQTKPRLIDGNSSIVLDTLRIIAALMVLIYHIFDHWMHNHSETTLMDHAAHGGVVLFFVLSGFVIAYTASQRNRGGMQYLQARFSRLYSVVIPALLITALVQFLVHRLDLNLYSQVTRGLSFPRYILSGLFMNEVWFLSAAPPINGPLWSLSYEFWYYIIFGFFLFRKKGWIWLLPGIVACIIAGPKILIMMPIWLFGYLAYKISRPNISAIASWTLFGTFITLAFLLMCYAPPLPFAIDGDGPLTFASQFLTDWLTGILVVLAIWLIPPFEGMIKRDGAIKFIRKLADVTFPIYVLHYPLIILYDALHLGPITKDSQLWAPFISITFVTIVFGLILEKFRPYWTKLFKFLFSKLSAMKLVFSK